MQTSILPNNGSNAISGSVSEGLGLKNAFSPKKSPVPEAGHDSFSSAREIAQRRKQSDNAARNDKAHASAERNSRTAEDDSSAADMPAAGMSASHSMPANPKASPHTGNSAGQATSAMSGEIAAVPGVMSATTVGTAMPTGLTAGFLMTGSLSADAVSASNGLTSTGPNGWTSGTSPGSTLSGTPLTDGMLASQRSVSNGLSDTLLPGADRTATFTETLGTANNSLHGSLHNSLHGSLGSAGATGAGPTMPAQSAGPVTWAAMHLDGSQPAKWGEQMLQVLHDKVSLQATQHLQEARIRLDPPDLGKLDLLVRVEGDRLNIQLNANNAAVRDALVQVSERLRAELQQQQFVHVDVNVGQGDQSSSHSSSQPEDDSFQPWVRQANDTAEHSEQTSSDHWLSLTA
ncbi:flagellar hook-length control protein FliK [Photobacterium ganghwense]|uniref:flagellar hook-length control protein FliK n=1 Tax=Photobacterium ganghwense TaxID=320778 RepID=UPI0039EDFF61